MYVSCRFRCLIHFGQTVYNYRQNTLNMIFPEKNSIHAANHSKIKLTLESERLSLLPVPI